MAMLNLISEATAETKDATLNDAVQQLITQPSESLSEVGKFFLNLWNSILAAIPTILFAILVLIIGLLVTKLCVAAVSKGLDRLQKSKHNNLDETVTRFISQVVKIVLYVLLVTIVLSILGIPSSSIVTVIGTAGVAIGLALQSSLSNVAGGFLLMITKPFKVGDYISVAGTEGVVQQISILYTRLNSATNQAIFIPNGQAVNATVTNFSGNDTRRVDLTFSISYENDFAKAQAVITDVLKANKKVLDNPEPQVRMLEHGASAVILAVRPWCSTADYWDVYFDTIEQVRAAFIANDITIPYNQIDVHMVENKTK